jgi:hypothetical protein
MCEVSVGCGIVSSSKSCLPSLYMEFGQTDILWFQYLEEWAAKGWVQPFANNSPRRLVESFYSLKIPLRTCFKHGKCTEILRLKNVCLPELHI